MLLAIQTRPGCSGFSTVRFPRNRDGLRPKPASMNTPSASQSLRTPTRNELIRTGLYGAQRWLDHGTAQLGRGELADWQTLVIMVERYLGEVVAALRHMTGHAPESMIAQLDATTRATNHYWYGVLAWCSQRKVRTDRALERAMDRIYEKIDLARSLLQLSHELPDEPHEPTAGEPCRMLTLGPVLDLIRLEAERALLQLGGKDARVHEIVEYVADELTRHVDHAVFLLETADGDRTTFAPIVESAIGAVVALDRALFGRSDLALPTVQAHRARLETAIGGLRRLRAATRPVEPHPVATPTALTNAGTLRARASAVR